MSSITFVAIRGVGSNVVLRRPSRDPHRIRPAERHIKSLLQGPEKRHQRGVFGPPPARLSIAGDSKPRQGVGLHLQINFGVNVGRIDGDVTKPRPYGIDIDAGSKQVGRS